MAPAHATAPREFFLGKPAHLATITDHAAEILVEGLHAHTRKQERICACVLSLSESSTGPRANSLGYLVRTIAIRRYHIPADDAEALVHHIFAAYLQRHTHVRDVRGWLLGAIGNASSNYLRKRRPEAALLPEHEEAADSAAEDSLDPSPAYVLQLLVSCRRRAQEILRNLSGRKE